MTSILFSLFAYTAAGRAQPLHTADPIPLQTTKPIAVFLHGYGTDHTYFSEFEIRHYTDNHPWTRITFNDAPSKRGLFWWRSFNMGQIGDALQIISLFWDIHKHGYTEMIVLAHSRGGAALITALHLILFPEKHKKTWVHLERLLQKPQKTICKRLQALVFNSHCIFIYPLLSMRKAAYHTCRRKYHLSPFFSKICAQLYRSTLSICSNYSLQFPEPIDLLYELFETPVVSTIFLCENDKIVSNAFDTELQAYTEDNPYWKVQKTKTLNHFSLSEGYTELQHQLKRPKIKKKQPRENLQKNRQEVPW